jgi:hypothetical protein
MVSRRRRLTLAVSPEGSDEGAGRPVATGGEDGLGVDSPTPSPESVLQSSSGSCSEGREA